MCHQREFGEHCFEYLWYLNWSLFISRGCQWDSQTKSCQWVLQMWFPCWTFPLITERHCWEINLRVLTLLSAKGAEKKISLKDESVHALDGKLLVVCGTKGMEPAGRSVWGFWAVNFSQLKRTFCSWGSGWCTHQDEKQLLGVIMELRSLAEQSCVLQVPQVAQRKFGSLRKQFLPLAGVLCWAAGTEEWGWVTQQSWGLATLSQPQG